MSTTLKIEPTDISPEIDLNAETEKFLIKGRSMPENSEGFYEPVLAWFRENYTGKKQTAVVDIYLDYYNTGSFIRLMGLFNLLAELNDGGNNFSVRWLCDEDDEDNIADGESFKEVVKIPFDIVEI